MSVAAISHPDASIGEPVRQKLAGFARTLRLNGFKVGLAETRDALTVLAGPPGTRAAALRPALRALFCATHSDWERFDEIFDAYWHGRGLRNATTLSGTSGTSKTSLKRIAEANSPHGTSGLPDHVERGGESSVDRGGAKREGASTAENIAAADL